MNPERICYGCFQEKEPGKFCPHCGFHEKEEQPYLALPLGTILNGRYMTGKVLGIGGFGITYLGYDLTLDIRVAIKEYMPSAFATRHSDRYQVTLTGKTDADYQNGMKRFLDEAKILAKLQNTPNIVTVQNYFQENNTAYFVMEYVEGVNLKTYLSSQGGRVSWERALELLVPVMKALTQVHAQNILHRDISPDNICITPGGESRLLDFGAARFAVGDGKSVSVILKHGYAPEEQYSSHGNQGPWTDVYAMGATLYRCITGVLPPDAVERMHGDTLKAPSKLGIAVPENVEKAVLKALSVRIEDRFRDMDSFIAALTSPAQASASAEFRRRQTDEKKEISAWQEAPDMERTAATRPASASRSSFLSRLRVSPVRLGLLGGGMAAAVLLCVCLSGFFSAGNAGRESGSDTGATAWSGTQEGGFGETEVPQQGQNGEEAQDSPQSQSGEGAESPQQNQGGEETGSGALESGMVSWELNGLNASIQLPETYSASEEGWLFTDREAGSVILADYRVDFSVPVYSMNDVAENVETVAAWSAEWMQYSDYEILDAGGCTIGGRAAFQIFTESRGGGSAAENMLITTIEGDSGFGCYLILALYPAGSPEEETEIREIAASFRSGGPVELPYSCYYDEEAGIQIIIDDRLAGGGVETSGTELILYPTEAAREAGAGNLDSGSAGMVETGNAGFLGMSAPQEILDGFSGMLQASGAAPGETYTVSRGGYEWLCQDYTMQDHSFSCASAIIDGQCYFAYCMWTSANSEAVISMYQAVMDTLRPL